MWMNIQVLKGPFRDPQLHSNKEIMRRLVDWYADSEAATNEKRSF